jgi:hypothetical protein
MRPPNPVPTQPGVINAHAPVSRNPSPVPATCGNAVDRMQGTEVQANDGTWVWTSIHAYVAPDRAPGCDRPFITGTATCGWFRLVSWQPDSPAVFGPWTRSCSAAEELAPSLKGWVHAGDGVLIEQQSRAGDPMVTQFTLFL